MVQITLSVFLLFGRALNLCSLVRRLLKLLLNVAFNYGESLDEWNFLSEKFWGNFLHETREILNAFLRLGVDKGRPIHKKIYFLYHKKGRYKKYRKKCINPTSYISINCVSDRKINFEEKLNYNQFKFVHNLNILAEFQEFWIVFHRFFFKIWRFEPINSSQ